MNFDDSFIIAEEKKDKFYKNGFLHLEKVFATNICNQILSELSNLETEKVINSDIGLSTFINSI